MRYLFLKSCCSNVIDHETGYCWCDFTKHLNSLIRKRVARIKQYAYYRRKREEQRLYKLATRKTIMLTL